MACQSTVWANEGSQTMHIGPPKVEAWGREVSSPTKYMHTKLLDLVEREPRLVYVANMETWAMR